MNRLNASPAKKILVAPLDWGLGHATRCIPIIKELKDLGCKVLIASEGRQAALLKEEFPEAEHLSLPGYRMSYPRYGKNFGLKMLVQLPKMKRAVRREHRWLEKIIGIHKPDGVISDNRLGLYDSGIPSVIMTHQLRIPSPFPGKPENWLQSVNYHYLKNFDACWVVDFEGAKNLAGKMSHPRVLPPLPVRYLGALSRFEKIKVYEKEYDLLVLISGPEPQRTNFEMLVRKQIKQLPVKAIVVCGQPDKPRAEQLSSTVKLVHHMDAKTLEPILQRSRIVLSRSGYTTVMDMIKLQKKAVFVPTPGQTEQEYLAESLQEKGYFLSYLQKDFRLKEALEAAAGFPFHKPGLPRMDSYRKVVKEFVNGL